MTGTEVTAIVTVISVTVYVRRLCSVLQKGCAYTPKITSVIYEDAEAKLRDLP